MRERYSNAVLREVTQDWRQEASGGRKWRIIKEGLKKAAEAVLWQEKRRSPDCSGTTSTPWRHSSPSGMTCSLDG